MTQPTNGWRTLVATSTALVIAIESAWGNSLSADEPAPRYPAIPWYGPQIAQVASGTPPRFSIEPHQR